MFFKKVIYRQNIIKSIINNGRKRTHDLIIKKKPIFFDLSLQENLTLHCNTTTKTFSGSRECDARIPQVNIQLMKETVSNETDLLTLK